MRVKVAFKVKLYNVERVSTNFAKFRGWRKFVTTCLLETDVTMRRKLHRFFAHTELTLKAAYVVSFTV